MEFICCTQVSQPLKSCILNFLNDIGLVIQLVQFVTVPNSPFSIYLYWAIYIYIYIYTGCPRRNVPNFGRVFLRLKYTDITQNTYIQSLTVTEIMARENCGLLAVPRTVPAPLMQSAGQVQYAFSQRPALLIQLCSRLIPKCAVSKR